MTKLSPIIAAGTGAARGSCHGRAFLGVDPAPRSAPQSVLRPPANLRSVAAPPPVGRARRSLFPTPKSLYDVDRFLGGQRRDWPQKEHEIQMVMSSRQPRTCIFSAFPCSFACYQGNFAQSRARIDPHHPGPRAERPLAVFGSWQGIRVRQDSLTNPGPTNLLAPPSKWRHPRSRSLGRLLCSEIGAPLPVTGDVSRSPRPSRPPPAASRAAQNAAVAVHTFRPDRAT